MSKQAVFTMKLESDLRAQFMAEAAAVQRPASQVVRELMRDYVQRQREAREYEEFLRESRSWPCVNARWPGCTNDALEAEFAARRNKVLSRA